jgi:hypothetical protein
LPQGAEDRLVIAAGLNTPQDVRPHTNTGGKVTKTPTKITKTRVKTLNVRRMPYVGYYNLALELIASTARRRPFCLDNVLEYQVKEVELYYSEDIFHEVFGPKLMCYNREANLAYSTILSIVSCSNNVNIPYNLEQIDNHDLRLDTAEVLNLVRHRSMWCSFGSGTQGFRTKVSI